jgi:GABA(A) receptor-associated protein
MSNADLNMITLQEACVKKRSTIDFTKTDFNEHEKYIIKKEVEIIKEKYPDYIPIVVRTKSNNNIELNKCKFLVSGEITIGQFLFILRKKISHLKASESIFLFVDNQIPPATALMSRLYHEKKDIDTEMLYMVVCKENTFGFN